MAADGSANGAVLEGGWFSERNAQWPGVANSLRVAETLLDTQSEFQRVQVFRTETFGNALVLDGVIQITERDECAYQEMMAHLPMCAHREGARDVLVVGGGDGGVVREVLRHPSVRSVTLCEIDQAVMDAARRFLPGIASGLDDPRTTVECGDAAAFVAANAGRFDVIVCDTSDPVGPAAALFTDAFYRNVRAALRPGGVACFQAESLWLHLPMVAELVASASRVFGSARYASVGVPTYPCGQIGALVAAADEDAGVAEPRTPLPAAADVKYYTPAMHRAAFVLPAFVDRAIAQALDKH